MTSRRKVAVVGIVLAMILVWTAGVGVAVAADAPAQSEPSDAAENGTEVKTADAAYVAGGGDVILAYNESQDDDESSTGRAGINVSRGLFHMLVTQPASNTEATGSASAVLEPGSLTANGSATMPSPEALLTLDASVTGEQSNETAAFSADFHALANQTSSVGAATGGNANTNGTVRVSPSRFTATGAASVTGSALAMGPNSSNAFTLTESESGYQVSVDRNYLVSSYAASNWNTTERARQTLERRYAAIAQLYGGEGSVEVSSHSFAETAAGQYRLDVEYTIEYTGVEQGVTDALARQLASSEEYDLNESQADALGANLRKVTFTEVSVSTANQGETMSTAWTIRVDNYHEVTTALLDLAASAESLDAEAADALDRARDQIAAQRAANLTQTLTWSADASTLDNGTVSVSGEFDYDTTNWAAFVDELDARGFPTPGAVSFSATARTQGGDVVADATAEVERDALISDVGTWIRNSSDDSEMDSRSRRVLDSLATAGFEVGRADVSLTEENVTIRAGASFENLSTFSDVLSERYGNVTVSSVATRPNGATSTTYVRVEAGVSSNADESEVRALAAVDDDTTVYMPGDWDREFPSMNVTSAQNYLGVESDEDGNTGGGVPGFGVGVAAAALALAAAGVALRNRS